MAQDVQRLACPPSHPQPKPPPTRYVNNMTPEEILALTPAEYGQLLPFDCTGCTRCNDCADCTGCTDCTRCTRCWDCARCTGCTRCSGGWDCTDCTRCTDCWDCAGIENGRGLRYVAFGVQLTAQQWQQLQSNLDLD